MAKNKAKLKLKPKAALWAELRVAIRALGSEDAKDLWDYLNREFATLILQGPCIGMDAKSIIEYVYANRRATVGRARELARPWGCKAKDVLREMAEYWAHYESILPDCDWHKFAWLCFGRNQDHQDLVSLETEQTRTVAIRLKHGCSFEFIGACFKSKTTAHRNWRRFLKAIEDGQCKCESPHCSMNSPDGRALIIEGLDAKSQRAKNSAFRSPFAKVARGMSGGSKTIYEAPSRGDYRVREVNGLKVYNHRLVWTRKHGLIPSEHEIHHLDGNTHNDAIGNLVLLPRWAHRVCHHVARQIAK